MACSQKPSSSEAAPRRLSKSCRDFSRTSQSMTRDFQRFEATNAGTDSANTDSANTVSASSVANRAVLASSDAQSEFEQTAGNLGLVGISQDSKHQHFHRGAARSTVADVETDRRLQRAGTLHRVLDERCNSKDWFCKTGEQKIMKRASRRLGFTLVELLVVIAIIGILVAITIPAVNMVRMRAQNTACNNNLRQLGMAVIDYESTKQKYPPSVYTGDANTTFTWVVPLLNAIDQNVLYDDLQSSLNGGIDAMEFMANDRNLYIKMLNCPSDPNKEFFGPEISYVANMGTLDRSIDPLRLDYKELGLFHDRTFAAQTANLDVSLDRDVLSDGESYTMLLSENANAFAWGHMLDNPDTSGQDERYFYRQYPEFSHGMIYFPVNNPPNVAVTFGDCANVYGPNFSPWVEKPTDRDCWLGATVSDKHYFARPSSYHNQGFNVAFADGSTRYVSSSIAYDVYARMMTPDGQSLPMGTVGRGGLSNDEIE